MKLIVGLGNPGEKYSKNRHNVGFMVVDALMTKLQELQSSNHSHLQGSELGVGQAFAFSKKFNAEILLTKEAILAKPQTCMNDSGMAVVKICQFYKIKYEDLYIVHDDLDIQLGNYKIQHGKGPKVHNGLKSVEEKLGSDQFINVRVGVENREVRGNGGIPGVVYSLQDFSYTERKIVDDVIAKIVDELMRVVS